MKAHLTANPFITVTSLAQFPHTVWALATIFGGEHKTPITDPGSAMAWLAWVLPAALLALAIDIGQIVTASELKQMRPGWYGGFLLKILAFMLLAVAAYYLQWWHIVHHMPVLQLAGGTATGYKEAAQSLADAAVWIVPALLPGSTIIYTISARASERAVLATPPAIKVAKPATTITPAQLPAQVVTCNACGKYIGEYTDERKAHAAIAGHKAHCPTYQGAKKHEHQPKPAHA